MTDPILIDLPPSLATERLLMRPPRAGDGAAMLEAVGESLPQLRQFLGSLPWVAGEQTLERSELWCRNSQANFLTRKDMPFLLFEKSGGELVGVAGLHRLDWATPRAEVGYWGRTSRARQGFVTEGVKALCTFAFTQLRAARLELVTDQENVASRGVAERCGFVLEGTLKHERRAPEGDLRNTCIYARLPGGA